RCGQLSADAPRSPAGRVAQGDVHLRLRLGAAPIGSSPRPCLAAGPRDAWPGGLSIRLLSALATRILGGNRTAVASDLRIGRLDQPGAGDLRDQWADLDRRSGLRVGHTDRAERVDLRFADGHIPGRTATDSADVLRSRLDRRRLQVEAVSK